MSRKLKLVDIKPLSVNQAWQGRRFKTDKYKKYERDVLMLLPKMTVGNGKLFLVLHVGFSSKASDLDNVAKPFIDILQKKYDFNDSQIYNMTMSKEIVKKGNEFILFSLHSENSA